MYFRTGTRFNSVPRNLVEIDKELGMFMAATRDIKFVSDVLNIHVSMFV